MLGDNLDLMGNLECLEDLYYTVSFSNHSKLISQGLKGMKGAVGDAGRDIIMGQSGSKGRRGTKGERGSPGMPGFEGPNGIDGARGSIGAKGSPGEMGLPGLQVYCFKQGFQNLSFF